MRSEAEINAIIDDGLERYYNENRRMQNGAISDIESVRQDTLDILLRHANENGVINRTRLRQVLNELEVSESAYEYALSEATEGIIDRTIERAINLAVLALGAYLTVEITDSFRRDLRDLIFNHQGTDGLTLADRIVRLSGQMHDLFRTAVRDGVIRGSTVVTISREISRLLRVNEYHIRRIIMTEGFNAWRRSLGEVGRISGVVRAIQIIDNRGRHRNHENHECYKLAERDPYGWGKGVYRLTDTYIYYPHPQCTAYFRFLLVHSEERRRR